MSENRIEREIEDLIEPLWWAGWNAKAVIGGGIVALAFIGWRLGWGTVTMGFLGTFVGIGIWYAGTRHINGNFERIQEAYISAIKNATKQMMGMAGDVDTYTLERSSGSAPLVRSPRRYDATTLIVGESSVAIHDDTYLIMDELNAHVGSNTTELYYDQISSVNYDEPHLQIKTGDGNTLQYECTREPNDALYDIQNRIREFKSAAA